MDDQEEEILFESWLYKQRKEVKKKSIIFSNGWKKKYFIIRRIRDDVLVFYYNAKPKSNREEPRGKLTLSPWFRVEKKYDERGKPFVCELITPHHQLFVATSDEKIFHLFVFFLQTQIKLKEEHEEDGFVVRPENSEDLRKIGAKANMCVLHISRWGITIALQLSKCVLGQWPLKTIKWYESTGRGHFAFEAGSHAPMGQGHYGFSTRVSQDIHMYDILDKYVMEVAGLREATTPETPNRFPVDTLETENENLRSLVHVHCDARFISHIRRISRDIYDHLWQHLGGENNASKMSTGDLSFMSDSLSRQDLARSNSGSGTSGKSSPPKLRPLSREKQELKRQAERPPAQLPHHQYQNTSAESASSARPIPSQYLQMRSPTFGAGTPSPPNLPNSTPPPSFMEAAQHSTGNKSASNTLERNRNIPLGSQVRRMVNFQRQQSRSMDDINDFNKTKNTYVYNNNSYEAGDVTPLPEHTAGFTYMYANMEETAPKYYTDAMETEHRYVRESQAPGAGLEFTQGASGTNDVYAVPYSQIRPNFNIPRLRKSVSNPDLLESSLLTSGAGIKDTNMKTARQENKSLKPNLPLNWKFLQNSPVAQRKNASSISPSAEHVGSAQLVKVTSPPVDSIQSSQRTQTFKKHKFSESVGMNRNSSDSERGSSRQHSNTSAGAEDDDAGHMETLC